MLVQLNFKSGKPVYLQVVDQIKAAAASGALRSGEPLPGIRPLAEQLRINRNTVAKAYAELEGQGIIETVAGRGCFLKDNNSPLRKEVRLKMVAEAVDEAIVQAHHLLIGAKEFIELARDRLARFEENKARESATKDAS